MADKSRERNNVDMFSNYGLDERQREISAKLGFRCFRMLYLLTAVLTGVWFMVHYTSDVQIPFAFVAFSYFAASVLIYCVYALYASKYGVINGITAFSFSTSSLFMAIFSAIIAVIAFFVDVLENSWLMALVFALISVEHFILYFCGKRNFKVLEEQTKEDEEDE